MTAIYAYACDRIAFVAGDTIRTDRNRVRQSISKVHHWSDSVVLVQAGEAQALSDLLQTVLPFMGWLEPTAEGFIEGFRQCRSGFWDKATELYKQKGGGKVPPGTVLVAAAATDQTPARVFKLDFETGGLTTSVDCIDADGTDIPRFRADAQRHLQALRMNDQDRGVPLDIWAVRCIQDAAAAYPECIGLPADVLIARPSLSNDRILVHRRVRNADAPALDLFQFL